MKTSTKRRLSFNNKMHKSPRVTKRAHFTTPLKTNHQLELASSPFTPGSTSDNLFQSVPNHYDDDYTLLSSPPINDHSDLQKRQRTLDNVIVSTPVRLALSIGNDGKASIGQLNFGFLNKNQRQDNNNKPLDSPTKKLTSVFNKLKPTVEKNAEVESKPAGKIEILNILKKMKNSNSSGGGAATTSTTNTPTKTEHNILPSSPPMMVIPETPRSINFNSFLRTGLTPKISLNGETAMVPLDQILLDDKTGKIGNNKPVLVPSDNTPMTIRDSYQFPFKYSVGDPLLINDDEQWTEIASKTNPHSTSISNHHQTHGNNSTRMNQSKRVISFGSPLREPKTPRTQSLDTLLAVTNSVTQHEPLTNNNNGINNLISNITSSQRQNSLQFTPLIQQTMAGSLSSKFSPRICLTPRRLFNMNDNTENVRTNSISSNNGELDASTVLKSLITGAK